MGGQKEKKEVREEGKEGRKETPRPFRSSRLDQSEEAVNGRKDDVKENGEKMVQKN